MPTCRKCRSEIKTLRLEIKKYSYHNTWINEEHKMVMDTDLPETKLTYRCPKCYKWLFRTTKQAEKFLKKGTRKDIKTQW